MAERIITVILFLTLATNAAVGADINIIKGSTKTDIDLSGISAETPEAVLFRNVLAEDLRRSGWFNPASPGRGLLTVNGECLVTDAMIGINCRVTKLNTTGIIMSHSARLPVSSTRMLAHNTADAIVKAVKGTRGIASSRILMIGRSQQGSDIYMCDYDGMNLTRITRDNTAAIAPKWSPDNNSIVYTSFRSGFPDVYMINLAALRMTRLAAFPGLNSGADISPDGKRVALILSKDGNPELYTMDIAGRQLTRLTRSRNVSEASPSWSPDGRSIVFVSDSSGSPQLCVIGDSGNNMERLYIPGSQNVAPDWGPDGRIALASLREGRFQICVHDPAKGSTTQITAGQANSEDPSWAPDGRHIAYVKSVAGRSAIYILDTLDDPEVMLLPVEGNWLGPAWSK